MPLKFHCVCGQAIVVSRRLAGRSVRCPKCDVKIKVPATRAAIAADRVERAAAAPPVVKPQPAAPPAESPDRVSEEVSSSASSSAVVRGCEPHPRDMSAARSLALGIAVVALCGTIPAVWDIVSHFRAQASSGLAIWAYLCLWLALLQVSYAVYLAQLPDWSSLWVATIVTLAVSTMYAMLLGLTYLSRPESWFARTFELSNHLSSGRAAGWCFIMLCLTSMMSYLSGRQSVRWYHAGT